MTHKRRRRVRWLDVVVWLVCLAALAGVGWGYYMARSGVSLAMLGEMLSQDTAPPFGSGDSVDILLIGVDDKVERGRADTLILASINFQSRRLGLLSVPRDTRVRIPGHGVGKINSAYALGGPPLCVETVSSLLGVPVYYYAKTDFQGIQKIVDAMGGVVIDVEKDMNYDDNWGNLHIHLKKGRQRLNGYDAMCYVRFRHDAEGDYGRMKRQKKFLLAAYRQMLIGETGDKPDLLLLVRQFTRHIKTNLSDRQIVWLTRFMKKVDPATALVAAVPSQPQRINGTAYEIVDESVARRLAAEMHARLAVGPEYDYRFARVAVRNASGESGLGAAAARLIRAAGYEVADVSTQRETFPRSKIFFAPGYRKAAEEIGNLLGTEAMFARSSPGKAGEPEVVLVLGDDGPALIRANESASSEGHTSHTYGAGRS